MESKFNLQRFADETTGDVVITIQNSAGTGLAGATVSVTVDSAILTVTADSTGLATFSGLAAGAYTFTAVLDGYASNAVIVEAVAGESVSATLVLIATSESVISTIITVILAELSEIISDAATEAVEQVIADLETEIDTTSSLWVKIRDNFYKAILSTIKSVVISTLISVLTEKIEELLSSILANEAAAIGKK